MSAAAIVVAGGRGLRMRAAVNKVFLQVAGRPILEWSLQLFEGCPEVQQVVVVANAADVAGCASLRSRYPKVSHVVLGGDLRHRSEFAGVAALSAQIDSGEMETLLVHDAVRPFATAGLVRRLLEGMAEVEACIPGLPMPSDTVMVENELVAAYPANLHAVQTPQAADATWLLEAHNRAARAGFIGTDTASVIEWAGGSVAVLPGEEENIKLTTPADLIRANEIAGNRLKSRD